MAFKGDEGNTIPYDRAKQWTKSYRERIGEGETRAVFFGSETINEVLQTSGAVGMRIYFAVNDENKTTVVLVPTGADGNNIIPEDESGKSGGGPGYIWDNGAHCPPICPPDDDGL